jgi:hypothetical protein
MKIPAAGGEPAQQGGVIHQPAGDHIHCRFVPSDDAIHRKEARLRGRHLIALADRLPNGDIKPWRGRRGKC